MPQGPAVGTDGLLIKSKWRRSVWNTPVGNTCDLADVDKCVGTAAAREYPSYLGHGCGEHVDWDWAHSLSRRRHQSINNAWLWQEPPTDNRMTGEGKCMCHCWCKAKTCLPSSGGQACSRVGQDSHFSQIRRRPDLADTDTSSGRNSARFSLQRQCFLEASAICQLL
jgi:hypothetical protein